MSVEIEIKKDFGRFALDVEFRSKSRRIGILGASGCGKSLTLKSMAGIEKPDEGHIEINGKVLFDTKEKINLKPQKRKTGYLFQNYALFPTMTVEQNIGAGLTGKKEEKRKKISRMLERFQIQELSGLFPGQLSGGQQQRVALARILAYEPEVILLDEPFSALDAHLRDRMLRELLKLLEDYEGTAILVSHSRDEIYSFSEEVLVMDNGRGICQGRTGEIFENPRWEVTARLTGCKNIAKAYPCENGKGFLVPDWGLFFDSELPAEIHAVGIRAHDFIPVWEKAPENSSIPVRSWSMIPCPFERKYFIKAEETAEDICWFVQKDMWDKIDRKGMPDALVLPQEKMLFLR